MTLAGMTLVVCNMNLVVCNMNLAVCNVTFLDKLDLRYTFPRQHDFVLQALGTRCMSSDVSERPNFDEILQLVDQLDVES